DLDPAQEALDGPAADPHPQSRRVVEAHQTVRSRQERVLDQALGELRASRGVLEEPEALNRSEHVQRRRQAQVTLEGVVDVDRAALLGELPDPVGRVETADAAGVDLDETEPAVLEEVLGEAEAVR